jgi:hypothetical protein
MDLAGDDALLSDVLGRRTDLTQLEMKAFQMAMPIAYNCHTLSAPSAAECDHAQSLSRLSIAFAFSELGCQSPSTKWIKQAVCLQLAFKIAALPREIPSIFQPLSSTCPQGISIVSFQWQPQQALAVSAWLRRESLASVC